MKELMIGMLVGVFVSSGVWFFNAPPWERSASAKVHGDSMPGPSHGGANLSPRARAPLDAYGAIARALSEGQIDGIRRDALLIARFFAPMNPMIEARAIALADSSDLETAKTRFESLAEAFRHPPAAEKPAIEL
ncbi:MAG: hypothetical protein AAF658_13365 [Myxococcota bacterium]